MRYKTLKLSVRLMTYNHSRFIKQAMNGIMMQKTNFPFEIVIGDDFSNDGTLDIIKQYGNTANITIKVLDRRKGDNYWKKRNLKGRVYNFQNILENCSGEYIALLDGDDYWTDPLKLQKQIDFLDENKDHVATFHGAKIIDDNDNLIQKEKLSKEWQRDFNEEELIKAPFILTLSLCFRNVIKNFPEGFYNVVNADTFFISMLGQYGKGKYIKDITPGAYRVHSSGVWSRKGAWDKRMNSVNTYLELSKYYNTIEKKEISDYFIQKAKNLKFKAIENLSLLDNYTKLSNLFIKERKYQSYIYFILHKLTQNIVKKDNLFKKRYRDCF